MRWQLSRRARHRPTDPGEPRVRRHHRRRVRSARRRRDAAPTAAPATAAPASRPTPSASASAVATVPDCGTDPVTLNIYHETISELMPQLSAEFTKQYPNVTFELKSDAFANATANLPRLLSSDNPPDISRAAQLIDLVEGRPAPEPRSLRDGVRLGCSGRRRQFEAVRVNSDFKRGTRADHRLARPARARSASSTTRTTRRRSA